MLLIRSLMIQIYIIYIIYESLKKDKVFKK